MDKVLPIIKKRNGTTNVAVFEHKGKNQNGEEYTSYNVNVQRSYKDKDGNWQTQTISLFDNQLNDFIAVLQCASMALVNFKSGAKPATEAASEKSATPAELKDEIPF